VVSVTDHYRSILGFLGSLLGKQISINNEHTIIIKIKENEMARKCSKQGDNNKRNACR
jgi:hypothetical protein